MSPTDTRKYPDPRENEIVKNEALNSAPSQLGQHLALWWTMVVLATTLLLASARPTVCPTVTLTTTTDTTILKRRRASGSMDTKRHRRQEVVCETAELCPCCNTSDDQSEEKKRECNNTELQCNNAGAMRDTTGWDIRPSPVVASDTGRHLLHCSTQYVRQQNHVSAIGKYVNKKNTKEYSSSTSNSYRCRARLLTVTC